MPEEQNRSRFEPPPWEQEAFERFNQERAHARAAEDLNEAILGIRQEGQGLTPVPAPVDQESPPARENPMPGAAHTMEDSANASLRKGTEEAGPAIPEARINAMLLELKAQEVPAPPPNMTLVNSACVVLAVVGLWITIEAIRLFTDTPTENPAATMLAATVSFVILLTGVGFLAVAAVLFRKYHHR